MSPPHPLARSPLSRPIRVTNYNNDMTIDPQEALAYHSSPPAGKIAVTPTKPCLTQRDLSLAYSPGVAVPCL